MMMNAQAPTAMSENKAGYRRLLLWSCLAAILVAGPARSETIVITAADCAALIQHVPDPGVEYKPGVDVEGNPVAPADIGGTPQIKLPDMVHIPITVDLAARYGIPVTSNLFKPEAYIGSARVSLKDGKAWFNGQPLSSDEQQVLARLCQQIGSGAPAP